MGVTTPPADEFNPDYCDPFTKKWVRFPFDPFGKYCERVKACEKGMRQGLSDCVDGKYDYALSPECKTNPSGAYCNGPPYLDCNYQLKPEFAHLLYNPKQDESDGPDVFYKTKKWEKWMLEPKQVFCERIKACASGARLNTTDCIDGKYFHSRSTECTKQPLGLFCDDPDPSVCSSFS